MKDALIHLITKANDNIKSLWDEDHAKDCFSFPQKCASLYKNKILPQYSNFTESEISIFEPLRYKIITVGGWFYN